MPKGMTIRRPQFLEMHATMIDIPQGADVFEEFNRRAAETGYMPLVILSGIGVLSKAVLRVPNDDALPEITDVPNPFGIEVDPDGTRFPELRDMPVLMTHRDQRFPDIDSPLKDGFKAPPHWSSVQTFEHPLQLIYAHGARSSPTSKPKIHLIVTGSAEREYGVSASFVGGLMPGSIAGTPLQFVIGIKPTFSNVTVQAWTVSVEPGYELLERLDTFLKARQNLGRMFILSATGKLSEAEVVNPQIDGHDDVFHFPPGTGPYDVEGMSGIIGIDPPGTVIHAAILLKCDEPRCDSAGGRLTRAVVSSDGPFDLYIGEMIEETDIHAGGM